MMRFARWCIVLTLVASGCGRGGSGDAANASGVSETERIHDHLARVERELRSRDVTHLTPARRAARQRALGWLREYRETRSYPHNHVVELRTPVFVDPHGTPCAVAYLMLRSGARALVEDVAGTSNLARVPELRGDARLSAWLDANGLTLEEAAAIQPTYGPRPARSEHTAYEVGTTALGFATLTTGVFNLVTADRASDGVPAGAVVGMGLGIAHGALLATSLVTDATEPEWTSAVNLFGAVVAVMTALPKLMGGDAGPDEAAPRSGGGLRPLLAADGGGVRLGVTVRH